MNTSMDKSPSSSLTRQIAPTVAEKVQITECPSAPKLDPRVRRTRKLLQDALRSLLAERMYSAISVADIAERATVNRATFYAHFEDKHELATAMLRSDLESALFPRLPEGRQLTAESLTEIAAAVFEFIAGLHQTCPKTGDHLTTTVGPTIQVALQDFIRTWLKHQPEGLKAFPGSTIETVATVLAWSIYGGAVRWSLSTRKTSPHTAAAQIITLLYCGSKHNT